MTVLGVDEQDHRTTASCKDADDLGCDAGRRRRSALRAARHHRRCTRATPTPPSPIWRPTVAHSPSRSRRTVHGLRDAGWLRGTVTVGQAFGGDLEAVTVHNGLLAASWCMGADVAVVAQGPGNLGTGTQWGFTGVAAGEAINAAGMLSGRPVATLRVSEADERQRHRGVSHHSLTAYGRVAAPCRRRPDPRAGGDFGALVRQQASALSPPHRLVSVDRRRAQAGAGATPVALSTMGRGLDDDPAAFLERGAAGRHAAALLESSS